MSVELRVKSSRLCIAVLALGLGSSGARSDPAVAQIPVVGRAMVPNGYQPARPCTLMLDAPGDRLRGRGLMVSSIAPARPDPTGEFSQLPFGADDFTFNQVNVFWHAQRFLARLVSYGLDLDEYPVRVIVTPGIGASTHQTEPVSSIGTGDNGRVDAAKDGDIIVHEITHAVFNPRMPMIIHPLAPKEGPAVSEGLADYFAAVVQGDTRMGEYVAPPNGTHDLATDPAVYRYSRWSSLPPDPYSRGKVLNGALLAFRARVGEVADALVFQALAYRPLRCVPCFADAMRWADLDRYGGAHLADMEAAFAERDIPGLPPAALEITGRTTLLKGERSAYRLTYVSGLGPIRTRWEESRDEGGSWTPLTADADSLELVAERSFQLRATVRDRLDRESVSPVLAVRVLDAADPAVRLGPIRIVGPAWLEANQVAYVSIQFLGGRGVNPLRSTWAATGSTLRPVTGTQLAMSLTASFGPTQVVAVVRDSIGQTSSDTLRLPFVQRLNTRFKGPDSVSPGQQVVFTAEPSGGIPPYTHAWGQRSLTRPMELVASGSEASNLPSSEKFELLLTTRDSRGMAVQSTAWVQVIATVDAPAEPTGRRFRVLGSVARRGAVVAFEIPDGPGHDAVEILDVAGRVRGRISLSPGSATHVEFRLPSEWDAGIYFARAPKRDPGRTSRFVVLP